MINFILTTHGVVSELLYEEARRGYSTHGHQRCTATCETVGQLKDKVKDLEEKVRTKSRVRL
jgi:hypothetical protein